MIDRALPLSQVLKLRTLLRAVGLGGVNVGSIDDLAEVISSDAFDLANRRMSSVLLVKVQKKASAMGYTIGVMTDEDEALYDELSEEELAAEFAAAEAGN